MFETWQCHELKENHFRAASEGSTVENVHSSNDDIDNNNNLFAKLSANLRKILFFKILLSRKIFSKAPTLCL